MKINRVLEIEELLRLRPSLFGREFEHVGGACDGDELLSADPASWEMWKGRLVELAIAQADDALLLVMAISEASRLVSLRRGAYTVETNEGCQFEIDPFQYKIYEWENGDISLQAGALGIDEMFVIRAPQKLLHACIVHL